MKLLLRSMLLLSFLFVFYPLTQAAEQDQDKNDHPLFPRFQGSLIVSYDEKDLDEYTLPASRLVYSNPGDVLHLEGKVTRIIYRAKATNSTIEIYRYYKSLLNKNGFETIFAEQGTELGDWHSAFYKGIGKLAGQENDQRYISARISTNVYTSIYVTSGFYPYPVIAVDVIEVSKNFSPAPLNKAPAAAVQEQTANMKVEEVLEMELKLHGKSVMRNILFNDDTDEIKPESENILQELARIIIENPSYKFRIFYYIDNVGTTAYCLELSKQRAEAIVNSLVSNYGADKKCISAQGKGFLPAEQSLDNSYGSRAVILMEEQE